MPIREATEADIPAITEIYNHAVTHTTAIWNESTVDEANRLTWLTHHRSKGYPVLVFADETNRVLGYATFDNWRDWYGYRLTVEHSVYVHESARGQGLGSALMVELIDRARKNGKHIMIAGITGENTGSIKLHERLGFTRVGYLPEVGIKFGRWLDLVFMQIKLNKDIKPQFHDES